MISSQLQWFLWGGVGFILIIHSILLIGAVFVVGEVRERLNALEGTSNE